MKQNWRRSPKVDIIPAAFLKKRMIWMQVLVATPELAKDRHFPRPVRFQEPSENVPGVVLQQEEAPVSEAKIWHHMSVRPQLGDRRIQ
jgi:hypothetical protein